MDNMNKSPSTSSLLCCKCGIAIQYNPSILCDACISSSLDLKKLFSDQFSIRQCPTCRRYQNPPSNWVSDKCETTVLNMCLKSVITSDRCKINNARFLYSEPNNNYLKISFEISHKYDEISGSFVEGQPTKDIVQTAVVEIKVESRECDNCTLSVTKYSRTTSVVHVRQETVSWTSIFYMEQIIIKSNKHRGILHIKKVKNGMDFSFESRKEAHKFVSFLRGKLPIQLDKSNKFFSHDFVSKSKGTILSDEITVELPSLCKNDVVVLPHKFSQKMGNLSQVCIVDKIQETVDLIDPCTARVRSIDSVTFFANTFHTISRGRKLKEFVVMDVNDIPKQRNRPGDNPVSDRYRPVDVYVCSMANLGTDEQVHVRSHLGVVLQPNDVVLGIDLREFNCNNSVFNSIRSLPDIVLVRKQYDRAQRQKKRVWNLRRLETEDGDETVLANYMDEFLEDLEEDNKLRQEVNMYLDSSRNVSLNVDDEDTPIVPQNELCKSS